MLGGLHADGVIYASRHGVHGVGAGDFKPTCAIFIAAVPVLFFNYVGFELPNAAGDEMKDPQKDVPFTVIRAAIGTLLLYGVADPGDPARAAGRADHQPRRLHRRHEDRLHRLRRARRDGRGRHRDRDADRRRQGARRPRPRSPSSWALLSSGTTWIMGADRAQAVAGFDGAAPRLFGIFSKRWGTPIVVNLLSGVVLDDRHGAGLPAHQRQRRQVLHGRARPGDLDHDDLLPRRSSRR